MAKLRHCFFFIIFYFKNRKFLYRHEIRQKVRDYILGHFLEVISSNEEMLTLPCEELLDIINDDALNVKNETPIWEFCLKWIQFDETNRMQSLPSILRSIRLGLLEKNVKILTNLSRIYRFIKRTQVCVSSLNIHFLCSISNSKC